jgi:phage FluMu protein Com
LAIALAPRHAFYDRCNELLAAAEFDATVEMLCQPYQCVDKADTD